MDSVSKALASSKLVILYSPSLLVPPIKTELVFDILLFTDESLVSELLTL